MLRTAASFLAVCLLLTLWKAGQAHVTDLLESCDTINDKSHCNNSSYFTINETDFNNIPHTFEFSVRISGNVSDKCQFFACRIDNREQNLSCALYTLKIGEINDEEKGDDQGDSGSGSEAVLIAFLVFFAVALLVAGFVILTLALMVRDMRNERVQDDLPNPYSCIFSFMGSLCAASEEDEEKNKKKPAKQKNKKKPKTTENAPKHYRRKEQAELSEAEPDSSMHSADDYEEMDAARKRDSFLEGGPDDVYQNT